MQKKKQYGSLVTYYSRRFQKIVAICAKSLFVGHCTLDDLVSDFFEFIEKLELNVYLLLALRMDGPNVNKLFEKKKTAKRTFRTLFNMGSCPLHSVIALS